MHFSLFTLLFLIATALTLSSVNGGKITTQGLEKRYIACAKTNVTVADTKHWRAPAAMVPSNNGQVWSFSESDKHDQPSVKFSADVGAGLNFHGMKRGQWIIEVKATSGDAQFSINGGDTCNYYPSPNVITGMNIYGKK
jgi:hypothetical protein